MNIKIKEFLITLSQNRELQKKINSAQSVEESYFIASPYLNGLSLKEFEKEMKDLTYISTKEETSGPHTVSDIELSDASGGSNLESFPTLFLD